MYFSSLIFQFKYHNARYKTESSLMSSRQNI